MKKYQINQNRLESWGATCQRVVMLSRAFDDSFKEEKMLAYQIRKFTDPLNDGSELYYSTILALEHDALGMECLLHALEHDDMDYAMSLWDSLARPFVARLVEERFDVISLDSESETRIDDWREIHQYGKFAYKANVYEGYCRIHWHGFSKEIGFESLLYGHLIS